MQEAIFDLGTVYKENTSDLEPFIEPINIKKEKQQILKFIFDTENKILKIDVNEELGKKSAKKYLHVKRPTGPSSVQFTSTVKNIENHIRMTFLGLFNNLEDGKLKEKTKEILDDFYIETSTTNTRFKYILNLELFDSYFEGFKESVLDIEDDREKMKYATKALEEYLKEKYNLKAKKEIGLYVIKIDDEYLNEDEEYQKLLKEFLVPKISDKAKESKEECAFCGSKKNLNHKLQLDIKYYTTNQIIFSSDVDSKKYSRTFVLCPECETKLDLGQKYISRNLRTQLSRMDLFVIPNFMFNKPQSLDELDEFSKKLKRSFNTVKNFDSIKEVRREIELMKDFEEDNKLFFNLDLVFFTQSNAATKIIKNVQDINPNIFETITNAIEKAVLQTKTKINLDTLLFLIPIKNDSQKPGNYRYLLDLYEQIFSLRKIDKDILIKNFLKVIGIVMNEREGLFAYSKNYSGKRDVTNKILRQISYLKFLENLNLFEKGDCMNTDNLVLNDGMKEYIEEMNYNEQQTALFLLGYMMGEIGKKQATGSDEQSKPILRKLSFRGADLNKLKKLSVMVFQKLDQYKIRRYNEKIHTQFKELFDKNLDNWKLTKYDNEFYVLSGYAFSNKWKEKEENKSNGGEQN
jgi:CRISPR-associated protein Csh1